MLGCECFSISGTSELEESPLLSRAHLSNFLSLQWKYNKHRDLNKLKGWGCLLSSGCLNSPEDSAWMLWKKSE